MKSMTISRKTISRKTMVIALALLALLQLAVLAGELLVAVYPRWVGEPIRVRVQPVDPRDLFRGNYARLGYRFNRVSQALWHGDQPPRREQRVYVSLQQDGNEQWQAVAISAVPPTSGHFLRGRFRSEVSAPAERIINNNGEPEWRVPKGPRYYLIEYGIEAWFAPQDKAQALQRQLRNGAWATLYVTDSGRAALVEVEADAGQTP